MNVKDLLKKYQHDSIIQTIAKCVSESSEEVIHLKNDLDGLDSVVLSAIYQIDKDNHLIILHDKEEASYFLNDLQSIFPENEMFFFPSSYKRPYEFVETENANVLMRTDLLSHIYENNKTGKIIITYPEALIETVINKKTLIKNTFSASVGDKLDIGFLNELLISYEFEKCDFVYTPGQFAIRGGILDVFSFSNEVPYRIEMFGNEIESIRAFDPTNQLTLHHLKEINIIPNIHTTLIKEERQGFIDYLPPNTKVWVKDFQLTLDTINAHFIKAQQTFGELLKESGNTQIVMEPKQLFETVDTFNRQINRLKMIEFGKKFYFQKSKTFELNAIVQPSFNKNFELLFEDLAEKQSKGIVTLIASNNAKQIDRLSHIAKELGLSVDFKGILLNLRAGFVDYNLNIACYTDHQIFDRFHRYSTKKLFSNTKSISLKELRTLQPGDYVSHVDYGIGKFGGMVIKEVNNQLQESIRLIYRDNDLLYLNIHSLHKISKYSGKESLPPSISKLGSPEWENKKKKIKKQVKDIAKDLIKLYAKRKETFGFAFPKDGFLQVELESSFIYEDTPDQATATSDVKADMEMPHPMDRLVCGDVGFGKTEIAIRAAFKAVVSGKQVAILVPTTILAMQHFKTFKERLSKFPVTVEYINRFKSTKSIKETLAGAKEGKVDVLIGTHRIVSKDVHFKDLGLLIIDEEQKFGVSVKEKLKTMRVNLDVLTLTATPIPRTLNFSLMGARDLSIISTPPPNRQPVSTSIHTFNKNIIRDAISNETNRGGQVFFVHNRIGNIEEIGNIILQLVPDVRVGIAHGQMDGAKLEKNMLRFIEGKYDVLISTNIIESGLDIPNANTIIINQAHTFGLSDLHQMRGRVGRSNKKAYCFLLTPPTISLSSDSRKRLSALEEFSDLGDGFKVAMRDLDIRGAGNLLGAEQSGFISDLGFELYHKILEEAVQELKENDFKNVFKKNSPINTSDLLLTDCNIETDLEMIIPESYVTNISERLELYSTLDKIETEERLEQFCSSLIDRFGPIPDPVLILIKTVRLRWVADQLGFEKLILKNQKLKGYINAEKNASFFNSSGFSKILNFVQSMPKKCLLKEHKTKLVFTINDIITIDDAYATFQNIQLNNTRAE